jgi:hypothetical protein
MYDAFLDYIEETMGSRFRFAVEMTVNWGVRIVFSVLLLFFAVSSIAAFVGIFMEGTHYILYTIVLLLLTILSLFPIFWTFGEDC